MINPASRHDLRALLKMMLPVFVTQIIVNLMGVSDTIMAGHLDPKHLAGIAIAQSFSIPVLMVETGFFAALIPIFSKMQGSGQFSSASVTVWQALILGCLWAAVNTGFLVIFAPEILKARSIDPAVRRIAVEYLQVLSWGVPAHIIYVITRNFSQTLGNLRASIGFGITGLLVKIPMNILLIYGGLGVPAMGGAGCGAATSIAFWAMAASSVLYASKIARTHEIASRLNDLFVSRTILFTIVRTGLPLSFSVVSEVLLFSMIALMIAPLGAVAVSSHQITYGIAIVIYLIPMSCGAAVTMRTSFYIGKSNFLAAERFVKLALKTIVLVSILSALITFFERNFIASLFTDDVDVQMATSHLLVFCAFYQIPDSIQIVLSAAMRSYSRTGMIMKGGLAAHWLIGFPVGYFLSNFSFLGIPPMGVSGYWVGLFFALTTAAGIYWIGLSATVNELKVELATR